MDEVLWRHKRRHDIRPRPPTLPDVSRSLQISVNTSSASYRSIFYFTCLSFDLHTETNILIAHTDSTQLYHPQIKRAQTRTTARMGWSKSTRIIVMLAIDVVFFILELGVGITVGSLALMADAFHMVRIRGARGRSARLTACS